jgi:ABC-type transport system involved in multi-copper enzyme maturation permease subunit
MLPSWIAAMLTRDAMHAGRSHPRIPGLVSVLGKRDLLAVLLVAAALLGLPKSCAGLVRPEIVWGVVLAATTLLLAHHVRAIFGPVFLYDSIRLARRGRYAILRCAYTFILFIVLFALGQRLGYGRTLVRQRDLSGFAEAFFLAFMYAQFLVILLVTPAYAAGAIAEEKERKTLEYLFATCLHSSEIVISKLVSRVINLVMLILAGLPIISLIPLWGGVDPQLVIAGFAASGLMIVSLTALSILFSALAPTARQAIVLTYVTAALYYGVTYLSPALISDPWVGKLALLPGKHPWTYGDLLTALGAGNIMLAIGQMQTQWQSGRAVGAILPSLLGRYACFHGMITIVCLTLAVGRIRSAALSRSLEGRRPRAQRGWIRPRPALGQHPVLWKEFFCRRTDSFGRVGRMVIAAFGLAAFIPLLWFWSDWSLEEMGGARARRLGGWRILTALLAKRSFEHNVAAWVEIAGVSAACLGLLVVAVQAADTISGERGRQTFDGLLSTCLSNPEILTPKRLGSIWAARWIALWMACIWVVGSAYNDVHFWKILFLLFACSIYASFLASLGIYLSLRCSSTLRATIWTLGCAAVLSLGPWFIGDLRFLWGYGGETGRSWFDTILAWQRGGLSPPLVVLSILDQDWHFWDYQGAYTEQFKVVLGGLILYACSASILWLKTKQDFGKLRAAPAKGRPTHGPVVVVGAWG